MAITGTEGTGGSTTSRVAADAARGDVTGPLAIDELTELEEVCGHPSSWLPALGQDDNDFLPIFMNHARNVSWQRWRL
jgi:hypothetical protein